MNRNCPVCGIEYQANPTRLKLGRETTCGRKCSYDLRAKKISNSVNLNCSTCGIEFSRCASQIKSKHQAVFCSTGCQYKGRSLGMTKRVVLNKYKIINPINPDKKKQLAIKRWITRRENGTDKHSKITIAKLSEITSLNIINGKINRISKIEDVVFGMLNNIGITSIRQYGIRNKVTGRFCASLDFFIPSHNTAIEVNGTFWHADERFYNQKALSPAQIRTVTKYTNKVSILESLGIDLIAIWEHDIKTNPEQVINTLTNRIRI